MPENTLFTHLSSATQAELLDPKHSVWSKAEKVAIDRYWDGKLALKEKGPNWRNLTEVASVWTPTALYFYFHCWFDQLNVNAQWSNKLSTPGLWEKDVVEVFIRPESCDDYFEIEASPLGQWLDIHIIKPRADLDYRWDSKLTVRVDVDHGARIWRALLAVPFAPMMEGYCEETCPQVGDAWRLNLYRMAGEQPNREYLSWCPTFTARPDFHIPSAFGNIIFLDEK